MSGIASSERLDALVSQFQARTLPRENWTHRAHLGVALWVLRQMPLDAALDWLRREISEYNLSCGVQNGPFSGYHETLTHFYARAVAAFLAEHGETADLDTLWNQLAAQWGDKNAIFAFYSRRFLFSPASRLHLAAPDLRPLPF